MTASTTTGVRAEAGYPTPGPTGFAGIKRCAIGSHTFASGDDEDGDIFAVCKIPAGATVVGGYVQGKDLDTGTEALDIDIGWAANGTESADVDGFGNLGLLSGDAVTDIRPETGLYYPLGGVLFTTGPQKFSADTVIQFEVNTAAGTLGGGKLTVVLDYVFDENDEI